MSNTLQEEHQLLVDRVAKLEAGGSVDTGKVDAVIGNVNARLNALDTQVTSVSQRLAALEARATKLETETGLAKAAVVVPPSAPAPAAPTAGAAP